jgi:ArsR family transcriptional regulator, arsenate/arsenite/antimonite-responsive transcriptional repressor
MEIRQAVRALNALAQESRLKVFRLLVTCGPKGLPAGQIATKLRVPANTMSSHLGILFDAGLVHSRKEGRSIIYAVNVKGTRALLSFLVEDCCRGSSEVCRPIIEATLIDCC